jgi:hypothetical protein
VTAQVGMASETVRVVLDEPDVLMATVALALLVGVGWLSAGAVRRRLAYETWPVLPLAIPHSRPLVADAPVLAVRPAERALPTADRQGIGRPLSRA